MKKNTMATPKIKIHKHSHNHKYDTRSKRHCSSCSSIQGSIGGTEHDELLLVGRESVRNKRHVACARLPDDLIFSILLLIPAKLLHENMRFVSRVWRQTITSPSFITNHLQISSDRTHGLLVDQNNVAFYIKPPTSYTNPEFQVTELQKPPFNCRIRDSYHGLVLLQHAVNRDRFHVANLVTKSIVSIPSFPLLANQTYDFSWNSIAFSYASSINRYKVVIGIHPYMKHSFQSPTPPQVWVYTVGVDQNWRKLKLGIDTICGPYNNSIPFNTPISVGGFIYWSSHSYPHGCALDVDTETFCRFTMFPTPNTSPELIQPIYSIICLETGLGLVITYKLKILGRYALWRLYELTDLKSSKWTKIIDIDISIIRSQIAKYYQTTNFYISNFKPLVYTNDEKLWFFSYYSSTTDLFYYHPREENIMPVPVKRNDGKIFISGYHHVNTLLALKNC